MNPDFPLLPIREAQMIFRVRRREKTPYRAPTPEFIAERKRQMGTVLGQVQQLSSELQGLTEAQRKAVFYKLEHDGPMSANALSGTSLKLIAAPTSNTSLVVPRADNLNALEDRLNRFTTPPTPGAREPRAGVFERGVQAIMGGQPMDRVSPELARTFAQDVKKTSPLVYEIELVSLANGSNNRRSDLQAAVERITTALGRGVHGMIYETEYAGATARCVLWSTGEAYKQFVEGEQWQQVITRFEARPKFEPFIGTYENFEIGNVGPISGPDPHAPTICIIDTGVTPGNPFLQPVVREDMIKSYVPRSLNNPYDENGHGSGVASLASYYALALGDGVINAAKLWIASARIMDADGQLDPHDTDDEEEYRKRDARLLSSMLRQVVQEFQPRGVRIFVMAYNIVNRTWNNDGRAAVPRSSWVARTIDQLSQEFDVCFVLITGNLALGEVGPLHLQKEYPAYLADDQCRLLDPGQSVSAITVGSIAHATTVTHATSAPLAEIGELSPFTRSGPGLRNAIKPDFVERGGNTVFAAQTASWNLGTDVLMASNKMTPAIQNNRGTSFAAPRVAYHMGLILADLQTANITPSSCLLKCFLAQSAQVTRELEGHRSRLDANALRNLCGYGLPDSARATDCDGSTAILYFDGSIAPDEVAMFQVPIPDELRNNHAGDKRVSVSLCYLPRVQRWGLEDYTCIRVKFRLFRGSVSKAEVEQALTREEDEDNVAVGKPDDEFRGEVGIAARSRGALQHDRFEWRTEAGGATNDFTLAIIASAASWGGAERVPFAVVVRIEDVSKAVATVHASVRARIEARATT